MDYYSSIILEMFNRMQKLEKEVEDLRERLDGVPTLLDKIKQLEEITKRAMEIDEARRKEERQTEKIVKKKEEPVIEPIVEKKVEEEPENAEISPTPTTQPVSTTAVAKRDTTRYLFNGEVYLKNKLVLAVVKKYVVDNPKVTCQELQQVFKKSLQGSIGVLEMVNIAQERKDYTVRFFIKDKDIIHLVDGDMYVCSQWGITNIPNFINYIKQLGFEVVEINKKDN